LKVNDFVNPASVAAHFPARQLPSDADAKELDVVLVLEQLQAIRASTRYAESSICRCILFTMAIR
jgi:hypothetical protein